MSDGGEQNKPSDSNGSRDPLQGDNSAPKPAILNGDGPGLTGLKLSGVEELLRDLGTDNVLPPQERADLRAFYTHEQNRLKLQLAVLGNAERVKSGEDALQEAGKALDFARSEDGRQEARRKLPTQVVSNELVTSTANLSGPSSFVGDPEEAEIRKAEGERSLAEATLIKARSELQTASAELERLSLADSNWKEAETVAKRWELSRIWEAITPEELRPAVEAIRHTFEHDWCWRSKQSTLKLCFAALHPASPNDSSRAEIENLEPYKRFLTTLLSPRVERLLLGSNHPAPVIFKSYRDVLEAALKTALRANFKEIFEIAKVRTDLLGMHPVEWAKRHIEILLAFQKRGIRLWIKEVCDRMDHSRAAWSGDAIFWGSWRAPRLIHMKPAGNTPYEQAREWEREGLVTSEELLEGLAEHVTVFLRIDLDEVARVAHVEFAKQDSTPLRVPRQEDRNRGIPTRGTPPLVAGAQPPDVWRSLHEAFRALAEEELRLAPHNTGDRWLRAYVDYKDRTIACGQWHLSEGVNERFHERFEVEATRAGIALGATVSGEAGDVWLHHVFSDLLGHKSKLLFAASKDGGIIVRACEASALYCARLEKKALVEGRDSAVTAASNQPSSPTPSTEPPTPPQRADMPPSPDFRLQTIVMKVNNPLTHTVLLVDEAKDYFRVTARTVHRWVAEGKLQCGARRGTVTIESIRRWKAKRSRKRPSE
jgi:hypothetical protein